MVLIVVLISKFKQSMRFYTYVKLSVVLDKDLLVYVNVIVVLNKDLINVRQIHGFLFHSAKVKVLSFPCHKLIEVLFFDSLSLKF